MPVGREPSAASRLRRRTPNACAAGRHHSRVVGRPVPQPCRAFGVHHVEARRQSRCWLQIHGKCRLPPEVRRTVLGCIEHRAVIQPAKTRRWNAVKRASMNTHFRPCALAFTATSPNSAGLMAWAEPRSPTPFPVSSAETWAASVFCTHSVVTVPLSASGGLLSPHPFSSRRRHLSTTLAHAKDSSEAEVVKGSARMPWGR